MKIIKNVLVLIMAFVLVSSMTLASPFNLPVSWVLNNAGDTIDNNSNGWPDYADNVLNASYAGISADSLKLGGELPAYYTNYNNINTGTILDAYISSAANWNAKANTGDCPAGYVVQNTTTSGVECVPIENTIYSAGDNLDLTGTVFSVDLNSLSSALENNVLLSYQNIINIPVCAGYDKLTYDGTTLSCEIDRNTNTQLSEEKVQDFAWNVLGGTQTGITVTYNDVAGTVDFVVDAVTSGAVNMSDLGDVSLTSLSNGQSLVYNSTTGLWENENIVVDLSNYYNKAEVDALVAGASGVWNQTGDDIYYNDGNVGIGTDSPTETLDVNGTIKADNYIGNGSQLTDISYTETDPVWTADKTSYYTSLQVDALPVSTFSNDAGYLTSYTETDPIWTADKSLYSTTVEANALYPQVDTSSTGRLLEACDYTGTCINDTGLQTAIVKTMTQGTSGQYATSIGLFGLGFVDTIPAADITGLDYFTNSDETDPVWTADKTDYSTTSQADALYADISVVDTNTQLSETTVDGYADNNGYLETETDPVWTADKTSYSTTSQADTLYAA
jgi:hypothetical protein